MTCEMVVVVIFYIISILVILNPKLAIYLSFEDAFSSRNSRLISDSLWMDPSICKR